MSKRTQAARAKERSRVGVSLTQREIPGWYCRYKVEKRWVADDPLTGHKAGDYEELHGENNSVVNAGVNLIWERVITKNPTTGSTQALAAFSTTCGLGVGISSAAVAVTQNDLQAATGSTARWLNAMNGSYPSTRSTNTSSSGSRECEWQAQYGTTQANFAWKEWAVFNSTEGGYSSTYAGTMLNRKATGLGTKTSAATWTFTVTVGIS